MTDQLPHDEYIRAVCDALTHAGLEPTTAETSDAESNRYDTSGLTTQLDALLVWDGDVTGVNADVHEDGIALLWEHPAEQWQWAPRKTHGGLDREPEFLTALPRWADPELVVLVARELLASRPVPVMPHAGPVWTGHEQAQAAVDAWAADDAGQ